MTKITSTTININICQLFKEVKAQVVGLDSVVCGESETELIFSIDLAQEDIDTVQGIVDNHVADNTGDYIQGVIRAAIEFFQNKMVEYASENVMAGITQAGKTKAVADYLSTIMRYGQSGSLYEVINEIDNLILAGVPVELDPFINEAKLNSLKADVQDYLA